jgi:hypothetical protein
MSEPGGRQASRMAVRVGFEPTRGLRPYGISSAASSTGLLHLTVDQTIIYRLDRACQNRHHARAGEEGRAQVFWERGG